MIRLHTLTTQISVLISFYQDLDFLEVVIERVAWADEILILDGPFEFAIPTFSLFQDEGLHGPARATQDCIARLRARYGEKISYCFSVYANEHSKRVRGYDLCKHNLVLLVDADELIDVDLPQLQRFVDSDAGAGYWRCINIALNGFATAKKKHIDANPTGGYPWGGKFFAFKKTHIDAVRHLDYLWLVGVNQGQKDARLIYRTPVGIGYHLTGLRGSKGQVTKFAFYTALSAHSTGRPLNIAKSCQHYLSEGVISKEQVGEIFARSLKPCLGLPAGSALLPPELPVESLNPVFRNIVQEFSRPFVTHFTSRVLPGVPCLMLVERNVTDLCFEVDCPCNYRVTSEILRLGRPVGTELAKWEGDFDTARPRNVEIDLSPVENQEDIGHIVDFTIWLKRDPKQGTVSPRGLPTFFMRATK